jgi:hypothetical protein
MPNEMPPPARRRFSLLDGMILVASMAPGFAMSRILVEELPNNYFQGSPFGSVWSATGYLVALATPVLLTMTPGLLVLRLRRPRRVGRRLWHSRGALNLAALAVLAPVSGCSLWLMFQLAPNGPPDSYQIIVIFFLLSTLLGTASGTIALVTRLIGLQGRSLDWVDRLGRIWGWLWIVLAFINFWTLLH